MEQVKNVIPQSQIINVNIVDILYQETYTSHAFEVYALPERNSGKMRHQNSILIVRTHFISCLCFGFFVTDIENLLSKRQNLRQKEQTFCDESSLSEVIHSHWCFPSFLSMRSSATVPWEGPAFNLSVYKHRGSC